VCVAVVLLAAQLNIGITQKNKANRIEPWVYWDSKYIASSVISRLRFHCNSIVLRATPIRRPTLRPSAYLLLYWGI